MFNSGFSSILSDPAALFKTHHISRNLRWVLQMVFVCVLSLVTPLLPRTSHVIICNSHQKWLLRIKKMLVKTCFSLFLIAFFLPSWDALNLKHTLSECCHSSDWPRRPNKNALNAYQSWLWPLKHLEITIFMLLPSPEGWTTSCELWGGGAVNRWRW